MRFPATLFTFFALIIAPFTAAHAVGPAAGEPAPVFTGMDTFGQSFDLSAQQGKYVILEWTNHECPFVVKHYDTNNMQTLQKDMTAQGVVWISVISSAPGNQGHVTAAKANELTTSRGASPTHIILDESGDIGRLYDAKTTPQMFLISPQGEILYGGAIDSISSTDKDDVPKATNYVREAWANVSANQPVTVASTKPYGCSVKY